MAKAKRAAVRSSMVVRVTRLHYKLLIAILVGVSLFATTAFAGDWPTRALIGWDCGILVYLILTLPGLWTCDVESIRKRAAEEDEGAFAILLMSIFATCASLAAIVFELGAAKEAEGWQAVEHVVIAMLTIMLSWTFVHTIFSFHYAHEYYGERRDGKIGGLKFPEDNRPDYRDFIYFSLVIGMTSQVSDVAVTSKVIRRMATVHGVLSFFFNLTVLALTVNLVSNLI